MDCLFCKMIDGKIPVKFIYEDENIIAINDINPVAPQHQLIIPRKHINTLNDLQTEDNALIGKLAQAARILAQQSNINETGYRLVMNCNEGAGQSIFHIHRHLIGGRRMHWPPG
jgi:histidine triad (HIT) family protein